MPMDSTSPVCTSEGYRGRRISDLRRRCLSSATLAPRSMSLSITIASKHQVIERAFGLLKKRFPGLRMGIDIADIHEIDAIIVFARVLYNMGIREDNPNLEDQEVLSERDDMRIHTGPRCVDPQSIGCWETRRKEGKDPYTCCCSTRDFTKFFLYLFPPPPHHCHSQIYIRPCSWLEVATLARVGSKNSNACSWSCIHFQGLLKPE